MLPWCGACDIAVVPSVAYITGTAGGADANTISEDKISILSLAIRLENVDILNILIKYGAKKYASHLVSAVIGDNIESVKTLLGKDGDVNKIYDRMTLVHIAIQFNRSNMLHSLIDLGADVNTIDGNHGTCIQHADESNDKRCLKILRDAGAI